uniref:Uncharacterized protein n=1 Tax=Cebus imitator TaxID=2715852 RepID=A0A2K5PUS1_CEBIM
MEGPLSMFEDRDRSTGEVVHSQNVMAAASIVSTVKSYLSPVGLDKMLVDDVGDVTITNDAKVPCELVDLQDKQVGDGTTSVGSLAIYVKT